MIFEDIKFDELIEKGNDNIINKIDEQSNDLNYINITKLKNTNIELRNDKDSESIKDKNVINGKKRMKKKKNK